MLEPKFPNRFRGKSREIQVFCCQTAFFGEHPRFTWIAKLELCCGTSRSERWILSQVLTFCSPFPGKFAMFSRSTTAGSFSSLSATSSSPEEKDYASLRGELEIVDFVNAHRKHRGRIPWIALSVPFLPFFFSPVFQKINNSCFRLGI